MTDGAGDGSPEQTAAAKLLYVDKVASTLSTVARNTHLIALGWVATFRRINSLGRRRERLLAKGLQVGELPSSGIYATLNFDIFMPHFSKFFIVGEDLIS